MRAILKCKTDLLWFGGIGTYVRASSERDEEVGDRANDALRVAAAEVNAKVIGEGANLGVTQRGRIEFAARGGRINTDFIDNSAGVNTSDQEVNIKIAIAPATRAGKLDPDARKKLLAAMTDDVAAASLRNNYQQSLALSLAERRSARDLPDYALLMRALEARGLFDARAGGAARRQRAAGARPRRARPDAAGACGAAELRQDRPAARHPARARCPTSRSSRAGSRPISRRCCASASPPASTATACAARSLRWASPTRSSTAAVRPWRCGSPTRRGARRRMWRTPSWRRARCSTCRSSGSASTRSTARCRARRSLRLYEATQDLVNAQTLWFLRNGAALADLAGTIARHKAGLAALTAALDKRSAAAPQGRPRARGAPRSAKAASRPTLPPTSRALDVLGRGAGHNRNRRRATGQPVPAAARIFLEIGEHLRIPDLAAKGAAIATLGSLRPPGHRPGDRPARGSAGGLHARLRSPPAAMPRPGAPRRASASTACSRRSRTSPGRGHADRIAPAGGRGPAQRACGGPGRSFSISQEGPSSGSCSICSQRKPARS